MGVFARLLGRSKTTQEPSAAEAPAGREPDEAEAAAESAEAKGAEPAAARGSAEEEREDVPARIEAGTEDDASQSTGIPKQQSAEEAADSEAGDGARR
ncbi:hypothetical protein ACFV2Z_14405 [Streptomyces sp. NPDC059688]|uniref:Gliding motility protein n=1 Tax=Streptomyces sp. 900105245 TaxID=3154379 RepID=A0ABV1UD64_9ACTN